MPTKTISLPYFKSTEFSQINLEEKNFRDLFSKLVMQKILYHRSYGRKNLRVFLTNISAKILLRNCDTQNKLKNLKKEKSVKLSGEESKNPFK